MFWSDNLEKSDQKSILSWRCHKFKRKRRYDKWNFAFSRLECERWQHLLCRCFETLIVWRSLFVQTLLFLFFPKSALLNWGCGLYTDAAYTRTFTAVCIWAKWFIRQELILVSVAWSNWEYFYFLDDRLVHGRVAFTIRSPCTHLIGTVRVLFLKTRYSVPCQHGNRTLTQTTQSRVQYNHDATTPPTRSLAYRMSFNQN